MNHIRVLVVDDSALMRKMIPQIVSSAPEIEVVGTAMDGVFALNKIETLKPDVITLDMNMPRMDGIETLRRIVEGYGIPVIIVSSLTKANAELTFRALDVGAFDFVTKPQDAISVHIREIRTELIGKIRAAYASPAARMKLKRVSPRSADEIRKIKSKVHEKRPAERVLAIAASTGGPNVLSHLLPQLPKDFPAAILIVQHMPAGFTEMFANRLDSLCEMEVKEAKDGDLVVPGRVMIAPGDRHMKVRILPLGSITVLSESPPVNGHRPSADVLFRSVAAEYGDKASGLIMTGMGNDGATCIGEIRDAGGLTVAQDEESCIVFGMPKAAVEKNNIQHIIPLNQMSDFLIEHFVGKEKKNVTGKC